MMHIDVQTIIIMLIAGNLISLTLFILQSSTVRMPQGDKYYIAGRIIQTCAWVFIAFHGRFFYSLPYNAGSIILVAGFSAEAAALLSPAAAVSKWLTRFCLILTAAALLNIMNPAGLRTGTVTGLEALIFSVPFFVSGFILCIGWRDSSRIARMTGMVNLACSLILFGRGIVFLGTGDEFTVPYHVHITAVMVFFILLALNSISYILFTKELLEQALLVQSSIDYLTGVLNRRGFESNAQKYFSLASRISMPVSLLMMDIDNFNKINRRFGHAAGDLFLKEFASTVSRILRCYDLVCRYGGEEFIVLLPNTTPETGRQIAERIRSYVDKISLQGYSGLRCSVCIGISSAMPGDDKTIDKMYDEGEAALYRAKRSGRNKVCLASH